MASRLSCLAYGTAIVFAVSCAATRGLDQNRWIESESVPAIEFPAIEHVAILCITDRTNSETATLYAGAVWRALHDSLSYTFTPSAEFAQDCRRRGRDAEHRNLCEAWRKAGTLSPRLIRTILNDSIEDALITGEIREWQNHRVELRLDLYSADGKRVWSAMGSQSDHSGLTEVSRQTISVVADSTGRRSLPYGTTTIMELPGHAPEAIADELARALVGTIPQFTGSAIRSVSPPDR